MQVNNENWNFHNYPVRLEYLLSRINPVKYGFKDSIRGKKRVAFDLVESNRTLIDKYYLDITNEGLTKPRILSLLDQTARFLMWLGKPWEEATVDDVKGVVNKIRGNPDFAEHTKSDYLDKVKRFDKWFNGGLEYTDKTKWVNTTMKSKYYKLPNQLLSPEEAQRLIDATKNTRDRAILHLLWESGARIGEVANLKVGDLDFDKGECQANLYGKTGSRRILLLESVRDIQNYIKVRNAKNPDEFVFVLIGKHNQDKPITYASVVVVLEKAVAESGLKKKVHPHLFRHSRASYLASKGMNEAQLCTVFGWTIGSKQVRTYIHLSMSQVQDAYKQIYGIKKVEETKNDLIKCQVCDEVNSASNATCQNCYNPLTIQGALKIKKEKEVTEFDRDISQKVFAEAFRLMEQNKLTKEQAQQEAVKTVAESIQQQMGKG
ncbi:MAG: tyrosine-type recombinase/integrase [archaeon]